MKLLEVKKILEAEVLTGEEFLEKEAEAAFGCDLMSDVLAYVKERVVLLTGLINPQVIRTAEMMDIETIIFVRGKKPTDEMVGMAKMKDIVIMTTDYPLFIASGKLYSQGLGNI